MSAVSKKHDLREVIGINSNTQEAQPPGHVCCSLSKVISDEDTLDHQADIVEAALDMVPEVTGKGVGKVHDRAVRDTRRSVAVEVRPASWLGSGLLRDSLEKLDILVF